MKLLEYVELHTERGECKCGKCLDVGDKSDPKGHTSDVFFFKVKAANSPDAEILKKLVCDQKGEFCDLDLLDGSEHNYIEIGGWIGDQDSALLLMGLGELLGLWKLVTPDLVPGIPMVAVVAQKSEVLV